VHAVQSRSAAEFLRVLEFRTGMLVEIGHERYRGRPVPVYEFRHLTFQEYLAALALVDGRFPGRKTDLSLAQNVAPLAGRTTRVSREAGSLAAIDPVVVESWREALRLCVSICNDDDVDSVLEAILHPLKGEPRATRSARLLQATACLADEPNASMSTAAEIAKIFAAQSEDRELARPSGLSRAATQLSNTRWVSIFIESLTGAFFGCLPARREVVGLVLGAISWGLSVSLAARQEWYRARLEEIGNADERAATAAILGLIWGITTSAPPPAGGVVAALIKRLDGSPPVAHSAAWALALLSGAPWRFATKRKLTRLWKPTVAQRRAIVVHLRLPEKDGYALGWLSTLAGRAGINDAIEPLKDFLQRGDSQLALRAVQALGRLGGTVSSEALIDTLIRDARPVVRAGAARALGQITGEPVMTALIDRLRSETEVDVQNDILSSIAAHMPDSDRRLLSRDFDGLMPFLKIQDVIEPSRVNESAKRLHMSTQQVQARFEEFSKDLGLRINW
jgi:HEAT repeat protein